MAIVDKAYASPLDYITGAVEGNKNVRSYIQQIDKSAIDILEFTRWNKLYPYALVIAEASSSGNFGTSYTSKAMFVLPIPPDQLQIQTPFAIQVTKTLGGVVEEHNGIPFKMIMASGTTGTAPLKGSVVPSITSAPFLGGVINDVNAIKSAAQSTAKAYGALAEMPPAPVDFNDPFSDAAQGTGYGQFRLLKLFLEGYARAKKNGDGNRNLRLLFVPFKDQVAYVVTPVSFNLRKEAGRALKYRYDLQLKSWAEFPAKKLNKPDWSDILAILKGGPSKLELALALLDAARKTVAAVRSLVRSVRGAVQRALNIMREVALFIKDMLGVVVALIDLPAQLVADAKSAFYDSIDIVEQAFKEVGDSIKGFKASFIPSKQNKVGSETKPDIKTVIDEAFDEPDSDLAYALFSKLQLEMLEMSVALRNKIDSEIARVRAYTKADFAKMRAELAAAIVEIADTLGASDATYDSTYSNSHPVTTRVPTQGDFNVLFALNDALEALNIVAAQPSQKVTTMEYVAGLASKSGIAFTVPVSKVAVPFPFDYTLEDLAKKYLKDVDRWMEIATLNGLREPYVDEVGFAYPLISNGSYSEIAIGSDTDLMIGQPIWLQSNFVPREKRHIVNIHRVGPGNIVLTLDGAADLDKFRTTAAAYVQAFLPYTVNSHQLVYIPSDNATDYNEELAKIPGVDAFDDLLEVGGIDMLLTSDNDLAITPDGDCRIAYGMQALIQRARIALGTPRGALVRHPEFGLPMAVGQSIADMDINELRLAISDLFKADPAFEGVIKTSVVQTGATLSIDVSLAVTGQNIPMPVNFVVKK